MKDLKVVFMGTPLFSVPILEMLIKETNVVLVVSQPDKLVGRHHEIKYSPIKELALKNDIPVFTPNKIKEDYQKIIAINPDIIITCAYGQIIPKELLVLPSLGCINVHASLLPKLRGGAPIHRAIIDGYKKTGITIMYMAEKMDDGDIISQEELRILDSDTMTSLHDKLCLIGRDLLFKTLPSIINHTNKRIKQNESEVTFGYNIKREEEYLDFNDTATNIYNKVRGLNETPFAYIVLNEEETKVVECTIVDSNYNASIGSIIEVSNKGLLVKAKDKAILITKIKPFGKKIMNFKDYFNGLKDKGSIKIKNII